jgi:antitoxin MazE
MPEYQVMATIHTRIVTIGNSRGIRIPKPLLEQAQLEEEVEIAVGRNELVIRSASHPRQGWDAQFRGMAEQGDDRLLDAPLPTTWDLEEWQW